VKYAPTGGKGGQWLIDPSNLEVVAGGGGGATVGAGIIVSTETGTTIGADVITAQLDAGASVALVTGNDGAGLGNIVVNAAIAKTAGEDASLTLRAHNDIQINAPITSSAGALGLSLKNNFHGDLAEAGHVATLNANLDLNGGVLDVSQGEALGNGTLNIISGTTRLDGSATINAAAVNVGANARVSIGNSQWVQGAGVNDGAIDLRDGDGSLTVSGSLVNNAQVTLSGGSFFGISGASDHLSVTNYGTITKTSGADQQLTYIGNGPAGRIQVDAGKLTVANSTVGGQVGVAADASAVFDGVKLAGGVDITGAGAMKWAGGVTLLGDVTLGASAPTLDNEPSRLTLVRGPGYRLTTYNLVNIAGNFVLDGDMTWDNLGTINVGPAQQGTLAFNTNAIFNNKSGGVVDVKDGSYLELSTQTTINNEAGAFLQVASTNTNSFSGGYQGRLFNSGTIVKTGAGTTPATLTNLAGGVLKISEGGFGVTFSAGNANAGTVDVASGAALHSSVDLYNAGVIRGTGSVELGGAPGATLVNNGVLAPGGPDQVGTLTINGNYAQGTKGAFDVRLSGVTADMLRVTGAVQLAGAVNLSTLGGAMPTDGVLADFLVAGAGVTGAFSQVNAPAVITAETTGTLSVVYPATGNTVAQVRSTTVPTAPATPAPSADICTIAPDSALCQVLAPPTPSEPVTPVIQQTSDALIAALQRSDPANAITMAEITEAVAATGTRNDSVKKTYCN
jgi:hypothetical protein